MDADQKAAPPAVDVDKWILVADFASLLPTTKTDENMQARVISYTRFSTLAQAKGQSLRRQEEKAENWAAARGLKLDENLRLRDLGVSAWSGANVETGALSMLREMAKGRQIEPGTILVIEAMDRLTRQGLDEALPLFIDLLKSGIELVSHSFHYACGHEQMRDGLV